MADFGSCNAVVIIRDASGRILGREKAPRPVFSCECGDHAFVVLTGWGVTLVSPEDAPFLASRAWHLREDSNRLAYAYGNKSGRNISLHRVVANTSSGLDTDHINGNGLDNRRNNLRETTRSQNNRNRISFNAKSGYRGVIFHRPSDLWRGYVHANGRQISAGYFSQPKDAAIARDKLCLRLGLSTARYNFPTE